MAFSNLFFVLVFLPAFLLVYIFARGLHAKNRVLLVFSLIFYAFSGIGALILLLLLTLVVWHIARRMDVRRQDAARRRYLAGGTAIVLVVLGVFKYTGFVLGTVGSLLHVDAPLPDIALPLGISFYSFKLLSYLADVCRRRTPAEPRFSALLLYAICFHHVAQGPILRYPELAPQLAERTFSHAGFADGIYRFTLGLGKKVILADHCGALADALLPVNERIAAQPTAGIWLGAACFTLQMYLDFSAYTDMALGMGRMLGFIYPENFDQPYAAVNMRDFWRRWHMTLGRFFRDYVYIPLGGSRVSGGRYIANMLAVWALTGLWHGASWNFVLWGLFHFVFLALEGRRRRKNRPPLHPVLGHIYTILVFSFGWVIFRFTDIGLLKAAALGFFGLTRAGFTASVVRLTLQNNLFFLLAAVVVCTPLPARFRARLAENAGPVPTRAIRTCVGVAVLVWALLAMAGSTYMPFLYNQF